MDQRNGYSDQVDGGWHLVGIDSATEVPELTGLKILQQSSVTISRIMVNLKT